MRRQIGLTKPRQVLDRPVTEFELDGALVRFAHTTVYGRRFETSAPRDADRVRLAVHRNRRCAHAVSLAGRWRP